MALAAGVMMVAGACDGGTASRVDVGARSHAVGIHDAGGSRDGGQGQEADGDPSQDAAKDDVRASIHAELLVHEPFVVH